MVSLYGVRQNGGHSDTCSVDLQSIKMLTMCAVLQLSVFCSVCDAVKEHELLSFSLVIVMSFVRRRHIIFQCIQIDCDFTLTMKLPWFLLNLVWLCMTNIQAAKLWPVVSSCTMHLQQRKAASRYHVTLLWRHFHCRPLHVRNGLSFAYLWRVLGEFDPLNVVGHRADPKKALPCVIARNVNHCAWKSAQGSLL